MARMRDDEFLRWVASMPAKRHQPFYEALRLNEIADRIVTLEAENADQRRALDLFLSFLDRQARLLAGNMDVISEMLAVLRPLLGPKAEPLPTAAVAGDIPLPGETLRIERLTEADALPALTSKVVPLDGAVLGELVDGLPEATDESAE